MKKLKNYLRVITIIYFIWILFGGNSKYSYMVWNIILAWVPLEISTFIYTIKDRSLNYKWVKILIPAMWVLWMLFYPNAPYVITDFIHISSSKFHLANPNYIPYGTEPRIIYNDNFKIWLGFINIGVGVWIGYMLGVVSLYINQEMIKVKFSKLTSWLFVIGVSLLSGFAIYLGRFIRWNSWDVIFNPSNIISILVKDVHFKAVNFTILFGIAILFIYIINYVIIKEFMLEKGKGNG